MTIRFILLLSAALNTFTTIQAAQQEAPPPFVGPGPSGEELAALPQTPGAKGFQERHYYFADAGREMGYHLYVPET